MTESTAANITRRYVDAWQAHDRQALQSLLADDIVAHGPGLRASVEGADTVIDALANPAFELEEIRLHDMVASGDRVAVRYEVVMKQVAEIAGIQPSDRDVHEHGMQFLRLVDGRIAEMWTQNDQVGFLGQVGIRELPRAMLVGTPSA